MSSFPVALPLANQITGQAVIATTGTAVQLGSNVLVNGVTIVAAVTNVANIIVGGSGVTNTANGSGNGLVLPPGASITIAVPNTNDIYINGTAADYISFISN